jgi:LmbE family N-acetylglucosaminyl deacetylase
VKAFRQRFFPYVGAEIKEFFDELGATTKPDLVFTHFGDDRHQDHVLLSQLAYNTFRDHLIFEYEIPKWDGDIARPSVYVQLDEAQVERKVETIWSVFESQRDKHWFSKETFLATLRLRGIECKSPSGYAEAFHCRKLVLA